GLARVGRRRRRRRCDGDRGHHEREGRAYRGGASTDGQEIPPALPRRCLDRTGRAEPSGPREGPQQVHGARAASVPHPGTRVPGLGTGPASLIAPRGLGGGMTGRSGSAGTTLTVTVALLAPLLAGIA